MDNEYLKRIYGLLESGATLGTGAVSGLVGIPYGLYKGITSGAYGTPEAPRIAAREAQQFMERNTYQPRTAEGQANLQQLAGLLEASKLPPVMPEASLLAAIPKKAYAAQAERAGMAAEKAIAPVVTRTMERGGLPAQLLGDLSQGSISPMDVWHGSPHGPFGKFDPTKARTGEGNATFGEGAYLAQARGTGETYRNALSEPELFIKGRQIKTASGSDIDTAKAWLQESFESGAANPYDDAMSRILSSPMKDDKGVINALNKLQQKGVEMQKSGYLYKVDLPDESIAKMLDYDKPLSQQAPEVQAALADIGITVDKKKLGEFHDALLDALENPNSTTTVDQLPKAPRDWTGEQILKMIERNPSQYFPKVMEGKELTGAMINPRAGVSDLLAQKGIPGVRYLDQMSRDAGEGTSNFVVFPKYQETLKIKEINDKPYEQWFPKTNLLETAEPKAASVLPGVSIQGGDKPLRSAVVLIGDKVFFGNTHADAIGQALKEGVIKKNAGKFIYPEGAEVDMDLFLTNEGQIIDRLQAYKMMDVGASESANEAGIMQKHAPSSMSIDEYMSQAKAIREAREKKSLLD
jgi:hypothetical protein